MGGIQADRLLRIRLFTHFAVLLSLLIATAMFALILVYLRFEQDAVMIFGIFFLIDAFPALYLHFEYLSRNRGEEYEVRDTELIRRKGGEVTVYKNNEIEKIIIYLSPALYKNSNFHLLAIEGYHYGVVKLKTGEELILTCLLSPRIDKALKQMRGVLFEKRKRLFCMI